MRISQQVFPKPRFKKNLYPATDQTKSPLTVKQVLKQIKCTEELLIASLRQLITVAHAHI